MPESSKPDYHNPYYWLSILAPPIVLSVGFLFATYFGVSYGFENSVKRIEEQKVLENMAKQVMEGANKYVKDADIIKEWTQQCTSSWRDFSDFKMFETKDCLKIGSKK